MAARGTFRSRPLRCPSCRPIASRVDLPGGQRGWLPEAVYVGFLKTDPYAGYKKVPQSCPACGATLVEVEKAG